jgi:hypothetical protein
MSTTAWETLLYTVSGKPGQKQSPEYQQRMLPTILTYYHHPPYTIKFSLKMLEISIHTCVVASE